MQAREDDVREHHQNGEYGGADLEVLLLGTHAQWAREHPPPHAEANIASASPRTATDKGIGNLVGNGGTRVTRDVIRGTCRINIVGVGGTRVHVLHLATTGNLRGNVDGRQRSSRRGGEGSTWTSTSAGRGGGISPTYGYFKFLPDKIAMQKLLKG
ncbi:unnamed protein product [Closterium sp. NIES-54]